MKPFNLKDPKIQRWFLFSTLLFALGFNLSWNPENTHIARYEYGRFPGHTEMASSDKPAAAVTEAVAGPINAAEVKPAKDETSGITSDSIDLGKLSSKLSGVRARYAVDKSDGTIVFHMDTDRKDVCSKCFSSTETVSVGKENLENLPLISEKILGVALSKLDAPTKRKLVDADAEEKLAKHGRKEKEDIDSFSVCGIRSKKSDSQDLLDCQSDEYSDLQEKCDALADQLLVLKDKKDKTVIREKQKEVSSCGRKTEQYFSKYLGKTLKKGLAAEPGSEAYTAAVAARDSLLADFDGDDDSRIAKALVGITANGVYQRGEALYQQARAKGLDQNASSYQAKMFMMNDIARVGSPLGTVLNDNNLAGLYKTMFTSPLSSFINQYKTNSTDFTSASQAMFNQLADMQAMNPIPTGIYDIRANSQYGGTAPNYSATGFARPGGAPARVAPSTNLQTQQFGAGQQQFGPNQLPNQGVPGGVNSNNPNQFQQQNQQQQQRQSGVSPSFQ